MEDAVSSFAASVVGQAKTVEVAFYNEEGAQIGKIGQNIDAIDGLIEELGLVKIELAR